jgi:hypothetical protein
MPAQSSETVLSNLAGSTEHERLLVVLVSQLEGSRVELRQQSYGAGVGWFTQSTVSLEPHQVAELRGVLGVGKPTRLGAALPREYKRASVAGFSPRVVRADSA